MLEKIQPMSEMRRPTWSDVTPKSLWLSRRQLISGAAALTVSPALARAGSGRAGPAVPAGVTGDHTASTVRPEPSAVSPGAGSFVFRLCGAAPDRLDLAGYGAAL